MGIYISGVKGLPEQVQQNKEDIKTIQEEIEGIDFDTIRQLETQVGENTQDINNLEASIGVQNQAINGLKDRADALESKTQLITYNSDYGMTDFRNSIEVADDVYASNVRVIGDGSIVNASQSGMHFKEGANDDTLTIANNDGQTPHYLHFNADGTLDIDGQAVGGATLYQHILTLTVNNIVFTISITNTDSNVFSITSLRDYILNLGFTSINSLYALNIFTTSDGTTLRTIEGFFVEAYTLKAKVYNWNTSSSVNYTINFTKDSVIPITQ